MQTRSTEWCVKIAIGECTILILTNVIVTVHPIHAIKVQLVVNSTSSGTTTTTKKKTTHTTQGLFIQYNSKCVECVP